MALVTFNTGGIINAKIDRFSASEKLLCQVKGYRATIQQTVHLQLKLIYSMDCALGLYCGSTLLLKYN